MLLQWKERKKRKEVKAKAELKAEEKVLDALVGNKASVATRESFRKRLRNGDLDDNEIEIEVQIPLQVCKALKYQVCQVEMLEW